MNTKGTRRITTAVLSIGVFMVVASPTAGAAGDITPPSVPQNLQVGGPGERPGTVLTWNASADDSGRINHYWVFVDGNQRARPKAATYDLHTLVDLGRMAPGLHTITVQAVDWSLNRSGQSAAIQVDVQ